MQRCISDEGAPVSPKTRGNASGRRAIARGKNNNGVTIGRARRGADGRCQQLLARSIVRCAVRKRRLARVPLAGTTDSAAARTRR